jgi:inosine-uridine nucleoside N-ribohydrolase
LLGLVGFATAGKIIIDTDGLVDDARALTLALQKENNENTEILAITTVASTVEISQVLSNVNRVLRMLGRSDIPVYLGSGSGLLRGQREKAPVDHGEDGLGDRPNAEPAAKESDSKASEEEHAAVALAKLARKYKGEITVICLGPLTNLALAQKLDPEFGANIRALIATGGNFLGVGNTLVNPCAEYSFHMDPEAAHIVLNEIQAPKIITPWETIRWRNNDQSWKFLEGPSENGLFMDKKTPIATFLKSISHKSFDDKDGPGFMFSDDIAVAIYLNPKVITRSVDVSATVELHGSHTRGEMVVDWINRDKAKNVKIIIQYDPKIMDKMMDKAVQ